MMIFTPGFSKLDETGCIFFNWLVYSFSYNFYDHETFQQTCNAHLNPFWFKYFIIAILEMQIKV